MEDILVLDSDSRQMWMASGVKHLRSCAYAEFDMRVIWDVEERYAYVVFILIYIYVYVFGMRCTSSFKVEMRGAWFLGWRASFQYLQYPIFSTILMNPAGLSIMIYSILGFALRFYVYDGVAKSRCAEFAVCYHDSEFGRNLMREEPTRLGEDPKIHPVYFGSKFTTRRCEVCCCTCPYLLAFLRKGIPLRDVGVVLEWISLRALSSLILTKAHAHSWLTSIRTRSLAVVMITRMMMGNSEPRRSIFCFLFSIL
ncbi:hypothetical protein SCHPADRAFT_671627 [Schizopora paradoxa]|uniref:Uncharacterized protein n=1 Tax=Schizopora paradoxa TaxID=27342 RepID=A0A0H2RBU5_9AGAM|nr:hypothetical protein SCHPADRAFT_671627 [Schizopora paradoxa]